YNGNPFRARVRPAASSGQIVSSPRRRICSPRFFLHCRGRSSITLPSSPASTRPQALVLGTAGFAMLGRAGFASCPARSTNMAYVRSLVCLLLGLFAAAPAAAAPPVDRCFAVSEAPRAIVPVAVRPVALQPNEVRLDFVGHSTWLIESAGGVTIATD